jgi:hypothetical protein
LANWSTLALFFSRRRRHQLVVPVTDCAAFGCVEVRVIEDRVEDCEHRLDPLFEILSAVVALGRVAMPPEASGAGRQ